jgi:protein-S-isoprenylcysteine O-methyltransferase Ste14
MRVPSLGPRGEGWVAAQLIFFVCIAIAGITSLTSTPSGLPPLPQRVVGIVMMIAGSLVAIRGVRDLGANLTPFPRPVQAATLVEDGTYRFVRHPIYSGIVLAAVGWGIVTGSLLVLVLALGLFVVFDLKARREEAWLSESIAGYDAYRGRTRKFIPYLY